MNGTSATKQAATAFILVTLAVDMLGIGIITPVLPTLVGSFVHGDLAAASHWYGALAAAYSVMQFVCTPIIGGLSDRFGRRTVIRASLLGAALDYTLLTFAPSLGWLVLGRLVAGATGASISAATAYVADVTAPEQRARAFGLVGAAFGLGFVLGPALGGIASAVHLRAPFALAAALNLGNLVYGLFVLPESLPRANRRAFSFRRSNPFGALLTLTRSPFRRRLTFTLACAGISLQMLYSVWTLYTQARYEWSPLDVGLALAVVGIATTVVQAFVVRRAVAAFGEERCMLLGLAFHIVASLGLGSAPYGWMIYVLAIPLALGGLASPSAQALLSREVLPSEQGELQGSLASLQSLTALLAPILGTSVFARFAPMGAIPRIPGAPFFLSALLNTVGALAAWHLFAKMQRGTRVSSTVTS